MKIRLINEHDWEKVYELDKSLVRVGSQISCDIQIKSKEIQPLHLQITRNSGNDVRFIMRTFADNVQINRGDQSFVCQQVAPQLLMDGDKISFGSFRMIINLEDEHTRIRKSPHIAAEMFLHKRELSLDSPINGALKLKNLGTEKACQFGMHISGIPNDCLKSSPLPYLYPGGEGTVGFMITHLQTRPEPGFHTVSITVSAPEEYFGEVLEFNQDIYVAPVFENEIILEDDSVLMGGEEQEDAKAETQPKEEKTPAADEAVSEPIRMDLRQAAFDDHPAVIDRSAAVIYSKDSNHPSFDDDGEEKDSKRPPRKKKEKVVVIHHDDQKDAHAFDDDSAEKTAPEVQDAQDVEPAAEKAEKTDPITPAYPEAEDKKPAEKKSEAPEVKEEKEAKPKSADTQDGSGSKKAGTARKKQIVKKSEKSKEPAAAPVLKEAETIPEPAEPKKNKPEAAKTGTSDEPAEVTSEPKMIKSAAVEAGTFDEPAEAPSEPKVSKPAVVEAGMFDEPAEVPSEPKVFKPVAEETGMIPETADDPAESRVNKSVLMELGQAGADTETIAGPAEPMPFAENPAGSKEAGFEETGTAEFDELPAADENEADGSGSDDDEWRETMTELDEAQAMSADENEDQFDDEKPEAGRGKSDELPGDIPVIHGVGSFDFDEDVPAQSPVPDKKEKVVVMKGGKFDD